MSPDGLPIYAESARHPGAFAITCHSGVTLTSVHALELAPALLSQGLPGSLRPFGAERFRVPAH
jgi:glycine/D-amino acid oxidase-like deaminating enzyme